MFGCSRTVYHAVVYALSESHGSLRLCYAEIRDPSVIKKWAA